MSLHEPTTRQFKSNVKKAMANENVQAAMKAAGTGFVGKRAVARAGGAGV